MPVAALQPLAYGRRDRLILSNIVSEWEVVLGGIPHVFLQLLCILCLRFCCRHCLIFSREYAFLQVGTRAVYQHVVRVLQCLILSNIV